MAGEGGGSVGRITALVLRNNRQLRDHILLCTCSGVVNLAMLRTMRRLAEEALQAAEICDSQIKYAKHLMGEISYGPTTIQHSADIGLYVVPGPVPSKVLPFKGRGASESEIG